MLRKLFEHNVIDSEKGVCIYKSITFLALVPIGTRVIGAQ